MTNQALEPAVARLHRAFVHRKAGGAHGMNAEVDTTARQHTTTHQHYAKTLRTSTMHQHYTPALRTSTTHQHEGPGAGAPRGDSNRPLSRHHGTPPPVQESAVAHSLDGRVGVRRLGGQAIPAQGRVRVFAGCTRSLDARGCWAHVVAESMQLLGEVARPASPTAPVPC